MRLKIIILFIVCIVTSMTVPMTNTLSLYSDSIDTITGTLTATQNNQYQLYIQFNQSYNIFYLENLNITITESNAINTLTYLFTAKPNFNYLIVLCDNIDIYNVTLKINNSYDNQGLILDELMLYITSLVPVVSTIIIIVLPLSKAK